MRKPNSKLLLERTKAWGNVILVVAVIFMLTLSYQYLVKRGIIKRPEGRLGDLLDTMILIGKYALPIVALSYAVPLAAVNLPLAIIAASIAVITLGVMLYSDYQDAQEGKAIANSIGMGVGIGAGTGAVIGNQPEEVIVMPEGGKMANPNKARRVKVYS